MSPADPAPVSPVPAQGPARTDAARALIEGQLAMLSRLAQIGMEIAEACGRQAANDKPGETMPRRDPGLVFARVARAVRMTIALQSRLAKDLAALDRADDLAEVARKDVRRMRLRRLVGQAVSAGIAPDDKRDENAIEDEIDRLSDEAYERLTDAEDGDLMGRPFEEVVSGICADLGLSPDWTARLMAAVEPPPEPLRDDPACLAPYPPPEPAWPPEPRPPPPSSSGGAARGSGHRPARGQTPPRRPGDPAAPGFDEPLQGRERPGPGSAPTLRPG
jgi:hypothetical protein